MPTRMTWRPGREGPTLYAYPEIRPALGRAADDAGPTVDPSPSPGPVSPGDRRRDESAGSDPMGSEGLKGRFVAEGEALSVP
jgi:hypothetical protein